MFKINYEIVSDGFAGITNISEEDIRYNFLLGNIVFSTADAEIAMNWGWIPLLDLAYCLKEIDRTLHANNSSHDCFEFTENAETLNFIRDGNVLEIQTSFSTSVILTKFLQFEDAVNEFHSSISECIREHISDSVPLILQQYLST